MLPENQIDQIKTQLIQQIESNFSDDQKPPAIEKVKSMDAKELEQFLIQNKLIKNQKGEISPSQQCIFCSIISGKIPSTQIDETTEAIAILEINPISKGHTLIIPKQHLDSKEKITEPITNFSKQVTEKIKEKLNPKDIIISSANILGHEIINIVPVYENETMQSQTHQASPEELEEILKELNKEIIIKEEEIKSPEVSQEYDKDLKAPERIP